MRIRTLEDVVRSGDRAWFTPAIELVSRLGAILPEGRAWFSGDAPLMVARAPGRLDVMGGIADYSGALVLQLPLERGTVAIAQAQAEPVLDIVSMRDGVRYQYRMDWDLQRGPVASPGALAARFAGRDDHWASYVVGVVDACLTRLAGASPPAARGVKVLVESTVPEGKGISSSAALEVASMFAVAASLGLDAGGEAVAHACQWAENRIAGAPCGIMDQMTAACGRADRLLQLLCQPGTIEGHVEVPAGYRFYGIDSGLRHAVTGADYGTVRTAAFMGYRMIAAFAGHRVASLGGRVRVDDDQWHGYLANVTPDSFTRQYEARLPVAMSGAEFLREYGGITDEVTTVDPERRYPVRQAARHPVLEHARVRRFARLLEDLRRDQAVAVEIGRLMLESHESYGACGLGSDGTDRLVALVAEAGAGRGLFGAKITGGGSGGTVAVFATEDAADLVHGIARRYSAETGHAAEVFTGSSPGAGALGVLALR
jgi:L-arabinokinase